MVTSIDHVRGNKVITRETVVQNNLIFLFCIFPLNLFCYQFEPWLVFEWFSPWFFEFGFQVHRTEGVYFDIS